VRFKPLDILYWVFIVAIIYMLVRPSSKAGQAVIAIANALAAVTATATGAAAKAAQEGSQ
jgi:uncharacterized membrane protein